MVHALQLFESFGPKLPQNQFSGPRTQIVLFWAPRSSGFYVSFPMLYCCRKLTWSILYFLNLPFFFTLTVCFTALCLPVETSNEELWTYTSCNNKNTIYPGQFLLGFTYQFCMGFSGILYLKTKHAMLSAINQPYTQNLKTNIRKSFLKSEKNHFSRNHRLQMKIAQ